MPAGPQEQGEHDASDDHCQQKLAADLKRRDGQRDQQDHQAETERARVSGTAFPVGFRSAATDKRRERLVPAERKPRLQLRGAVGSPAQRTGVPGARGRLRAGGALEGATSITDTAGRLPPFPHPIGLASPPSLHHHAAGN